MYSKAEFYLKKIEEIDNHKEKLTNELSFCNSRYHDLENAFQDETKRLQNHINVLNTQEEKTSVLLHSEIDLLRKELLKAQSLCKEKDVQTFELQKEMNHVLKTQDGKRPFINEVKPVQACQ
jgi:hypothetical protein